MRYYIMRRNGRPVPHNGPDVLRLADADAKAKRDQLAAIGAELIECDEDGVPTGQSVTHAEAKATASAAADAVRETLSAEIARLERDLAASIEREASERGALVAEIQRLEGEVNRAEEEAAAANAALLALRSEVTAAARFTWETINEANPRSGYRNVAKLLRVKANKAAVIDAVGQITSVGLLVALTALAASAQAENDGESPKTDEGGGAEAEEAP